MFTLCRNVFWHYTSKQEAKRVAKAKRDKEKKNNPKKFLLIHDTFEERKKATFESIFEENMFLLSVVLAFQKKLNRMLTSIGPCGPSMKDCPEKSGNLRKPAAEFSGK